MVPLPPPQWTPSTLKAFAEHCEIRNATEALILRRQNADRHCSRYPLSNSSGYRCPTCDCIQETNRKSDEDNVGKLE